MYIVLGKGSAMAENETTKLKLTDSVDLTSANYAKIAENLVRKRSDRNGKSVGWSNGRRNLSTSKLRSIYSLITNVYTRVNTPQDFDKYKSDLQYIKVKMAYESGRDEVVKDFLKNTGLMALLDHIKNYDQFILYCRYSESLVAFFKFYGGKDN